MVPGSNRIDVEPRLLGALREHRDCVRGESDCCGLLAAAGEFYMTTAHHAHSVHALEKLMGTWVNVATAYDKGEDLDGPVHRMYETAFTYRLLLS